MRRKPRRSADGPSPAGDGSISAHGDITGIASTGDFATNVQATVVPPEVFRPVSEVAARSGLMNLPVRPNLFVGREKGLADLQAMLTVESGPVIVIVAGLGGVGKSTLAARYVATCSGDHALVWWIPAYSTAAIDAGLVELALAVQPALSRALSLEALREWALQWLACHDQWLLVLDNVNHPADIEPLTGRLATGRFLITSRLAAGWSAVTSSVVRLDVLTEEQAVELLTRIAPGERDGTRELCTELGCLPLAIGQAGAYIAETAISPRTYLELLAKYPAAMFDAVAVAGDPKRTIARIWRVTLDRLADEPLAGQVLRILAWYAPDPIPRTLLTALAEPPDLHQAIGRLAAYSMLTAGGDMTVTVHRLVQAVTRTPDADDPHRAPDCIDDARTKATTLLLDAIPPYWSDPATWPVWRTVLPHVGAVADQASPSTDTVAMAYLLDRTGLFMDNQGASSRAIRLLDRAVTDCVRLLGEDHPDTLTSRNNLAIAYESAGNLGRAIPLYEQTLTGCVRVLGADHPGTLSCRNNLAHAYQAAGDLGRAISAYEQTLTGSVRVLGADHPGTLTSRHNLAGAYFEAGDLRRAILLSEQVLADSVRLLGEDHPDTLTTRRDLARIYREAGDLRRAISLYEQLFRDCVRVLGEDHPDTLTTRRDLAYAYQSAGNLVRAIPLYEQALTDSVRVLGEDHPGTLASRSSLAGAFLLAGNLGRAVPLHERALADSVRLLGEDNPSTLNARNNLAYAYQSAGDLGRAVPLHEQTLADRRRVLGEGHPDTLISLNNLAGAYREAGKLARTILLYEQALAGCVRVLGEDHPSTLGTMNNLAGAYREARRPARAISLYGQALAGCVRVLGEDHPTSLITRSNLASAYLLSGDPGRAVPLYEQTLTRCVRVLGQDHPTSVRVRDSLALARRRSR
jgi:tetratricopeptide (TPR) repeat protein